MTGIANSDEWIANQRDGGTCPPDRTPRRWRQQWAERGHIQRFCKTGNNRAEVLRGNDLV